jgi:hypothetical protein
MESIVPSIFSSLDASWKPLSAGLYGPLALIVALTLSSVAFLWIFYFKVAKRSYQIPESYPFEFCNTVLKRKDDNLLHFLLDVYKQAHQRTGKSTFSAHFPFQSTMVFINEPAVIEHVLKTKFENYIKGAEWYKRMRHFLGNR